MEDVKRICKNLSSPDRKVRIQCYQELQHHFDTELKNQELLDIFSETRIYFLNGLRDKAETVRESAIKFLTFLVLEKCPINDYYLTYIFPLLVERSGSPELVEESEEIRLQLLQFLQKLIEKYAETEQLRPFLNDCVTILAETLKDKFPAVVELSCETVSLLVEALPKDFHNQAETILRGVLECTKNRRFKIRKCAVLAVEKTIMHCSYKGVDESLVPMAQLVFDPNDDVRKTLYITTSNWLKTHPDRYSYFHKWLPILLSGMNDRLHQQEVFEYFQLVGQKYLQENEQEFKDQLNYLDRPSFYPIKYKRGNLGCRILVQRNISKILPALRREISDWQDDVRRQSGGLLASLIAYSEDSVTMHLQTIMPMLYELAKDKNLDDCTELSGFFIGAFVQFDVWWTQLVPMLNNPNFNHIKVLRSLLIGAAKDSKLNAETVKSVANQLGNPSVCRVKQLAYQKAFHSYLISFVESAVPFQDIDSVYKCFLAITTLLALKNPEIDDQEMNPDLYNILQVSTAILLEQHSENLLKTINDSPALWTAVTDEARIFMLLMSISPVPFRCNPKLVIDILVEILGAKADKGLKLKMFYILSERFRQDDLWSQHTVVEVNQRLVLDIFVPSLTWHAGAAEEAVRTMTTTCVMHFLSQENLEKHEAFNKLFPLLISLLDDDSATTRQMAICSLVLLKRKLFDGEWSMDHFRKMHEGIFNKFDDPTLKVCQKAFEAVPELFENVPIEYNSSTTKPLRDAIWGKLMPFLDDDSLSQLANVALQAVIKSTDNSQEMADTVKCLRSGLKNQATDLLALIESVSLLRVQ